MEQDIERLKEKINNIKKYDTYRYDWTETDVQTVENLIKAYKELEEKNKKKSIEIICYQEELENSIPVSLVEEKIEELNKKEKELQNNISDEEREEYSDANISFGLMDIEIRRSVLQELLERRK